MDIVGYTPPPSQHRAAVRARAKQSPLSPDTRRARYVPPPASADDFFLLDPHGRARLEAPS
jgi:hypothetical protein